MQIYVHRNEQQLGPFTEAEVKAQLISGTISSQDLVWWEGQPGWVPLGQSFLAANPNPVSLASPPPVGSAPVTTASTVASPAPLERTSGLAIGALVSGIASFFFGFTFIVAIILGHMGLSEIRKNPGMKGRGMAIAGLALGYMIPVLAFVAVVAISVLLALGNQVKATFKTINTQLAEAQNSTADTNNAPDSTTNAVPQTNGP